MKNKEYINKIFELINNYDNNITVFIDIIKEEQLELHLNNKKENKNNFESGVSILINTSDDDIFENNKCRTYKEAFYFVKKIVNKIKKSEENKKNQKSIIKKKYKRIKRINKKQKYRLNEKIISYLPKMDSIKVSFYEKNEYKYIISNKSNIIILQKNNLIKIMIKGIIKNIEIYDFIVSNQGINLIKSDDIYDLINRYNIIFKLKTNNAKIISGNYNIVFSNNCGTLFHELFGHNLELDLINKNNINYFYIGKKICNNLITYIDDPECVPKLYLKYDSFNNIRERNILIKNGIINNYIVKSSYRTESYKYKPTTRMSNTYLKPIFDNDVNLFQNYIYIYKIKKGRLHLETGFIEIWFDAGWIVKNGVKENNISDLYLKIRIDEFIKKIVFIGNDLNFVPTICGTESGNVPSYVGCPTVGVKEINIIQQ